MYIPETIVYYLRPTQEYTLVLPVEPHATLQARPAFPVNKDAKDAVHARAQLWAGDACEVVEVANKPQGGYRLVGAEQRREGGRAWKVRTPEGYLVDMRERVFLPILLSAGLPADGIIPAEFQWAQNGSQMSLLQVGSLEHALYLEHAAATFAAKKQPLKTQGVRDLVVGGLYYWGSGKTTPVLKVYLGRVRYEGKLKTAWYDPPTRGEFVNGARFYVVDKGKLTEPGLEYVTRALQQRSTCVEVASRSMATQLVPDIPVFDVKGIRHSRRFLDLWGLPIHDEVKWV